MRKRKFEAEKQQSESPSNKVPRKEVEENKFLELPSEIHHHIFSFLDRQSQVLVRLTNRQLNNSMDDFFCYQHPSKVAADRVNAAKLLISELFSGINTETGHFFSPILLTDVMSNDKIQPCSDKVVPLSKYYRMVIEEVASSISLSSLCSTLIELSLNGQTYFAILGDSKQTLIHFFMASLDVASITMMLKHIEKMSDLNEGGAINNIEADFHIPDKNGHYPFELMLLQSKIKDGKVIHLPSIQLLTYVSNNPLFIPITGKNAFESGIEHILDVYTQSQDPNCLKCLAFLHTTLKQSAVDYVSKYHHLDDLDKYHRKINKELDAVRLGEKLKESIGNEAQQQFEDYCASFLVSSVGCVNTI